METRLESALWAVCEVCRIAVPFASDEYETEWANGAEVDGAYRFARVRDEEQIWARLGLVEEDDVELVCPNCLGTRIREVGTMAERREFRAWMRERQRGSEPAE